MKIRKKRRKKQTLQITNNSKEYKMTKRELTLGCNICPPNKGCNRNRDNDFKSWKRYRKTQWKESTHMPL